MYLAINRETPDSSPATAHIGRVAVVGAIAVRVDGHGTGFLGDNHVSVHVLLLAGGGSVSRCSSNSIKTASEKGSREKQQVALGNSSTYVAETTGTLQGGASLECFAFAVGVVVEGG